MQLLPRLLELVRAGLELAADLGQLVLQPLDLGPQLLSLALGLLAGLGELGLEPLVPGLLLAAAQLRLGERGAGLFELIVELAGLNFRLLDAVACGVQLGVQCLNVVRLLPAPRGERLGGGVGDPLGAGERGARLLRLFRQALGDGVVRLEGRRGRQRLLGTRWRRRGLVEAGERLFGAGARG